MYQSTIARSSMLLIAALLMSTFVSPALGSTVYDEFTEGDLSNRYPDPTELGVLGPGNNTVTGTSSYVELGGDFFPEGDNARFEIPTGWLLTDLYFHVDLQAALRLYDVGPDGETLYPPFATDDSITEDLELLDYIGTPSLGPGRYVISVFNNTDDETSTLNWSYDIVVTPTPAALPMAAALVVPLLLCRPQSRR